MNVIFFTLMLPVEVRILPTYEVVANIGLLNTYSGLIFPLIASATATFLFRQFFLTVPNEIIEAAKIDGANIWQMTWYVTMPYLKGVMIVAALFRVVDSIKAFPLIYILTDGGPGSLTEVTNYYSFMQAFNFSYLGYSSAITVSLVIATILASWVIIRLVGWGNPNG